MKPPLFELLRQLLNFETSRAKLLQIVLFGQNELATKIDRMPQLKDRITIFGALTSLTREDTVKAPPAYLPPGGRLGAPGSCLGVATAPARQQIIGCQLPLQLRLEIIEQPCDCMHIGPLGFAARHLGECIHAHARRLVDALIGAALAGAPGRLIHQFS